MKTETEELLNRIKASTKEVYQKIMNDHEFMTKCVNGIMDSIKKSREMTKGLDSKSEEEIQKIQKKVMAQGEQEQLNMFEPVMRSLAPVKHSFLKEIAALTLDEYIEFDTVHAEYIVQEFSSFNQFLIDFAKPHIENLFAELDKEEGHSCCPIYPISSGNNGNGLEN